MLLDKWYQNVSKQEHVHLLCLSQQHLYLAKVLGGLAAAGKLVNALHHSQKKRKSKVNIIFFI